MRRLLATLIVSLAALAAASAGASKVVPAVTLSVTPSAPAAQGQSRTPSGRRDYGVAFRVTVEADQQCANLAVTYSYTALFDGRRSLAGSTTDFYETNAPASSASFDVHALANAADQVSFSATGTCQDADGNAIATSAPVRAKIGVPPYSCAEGPLRVYVAHGSVRREDLVSHSALVPVRSRDYVWTGYRVVVGRRSRISFGATECHGLRVTVGGPATLVPGDYAAGSYGTSMLLGYGAAADVRGDQHSGGVETGNAVALPSGVRTGRSRVARYQVFSSAQRFGRITRVRVVRGKVYVAGRIGGRGRKYGPPILVSAGHGATVTCGSASRCAPRLTRP